MVRSQRRECRGVQRCVRREVRREPPARVGRCESGAATDGGDAAACRGHRVAEETDVGGVAAVFVARAEVGEAGDLGPVAGHLRARRPVAAGGQLGGGAIDGALAGADGQPAGDRAGPPGRRADRHRGKRRGVGQAPEVGGGRLVDVLPAQAGDADEDDGLPGAVSLRRRGAPWRCGGHRCRSERDDSERNRKATTHGGHPARLGDHSRCRVRASVQTRDRRGATW